ncbi:MAG: hypothetical protein Q4Q06_00415 [Bacteroidota bacterium]|nr:hypothetical protein [Bacteroidota bacterium]
MEDSKIKEIFFNRAEVEQAERIVCDNCFEHMVFMLRDSQQHEFSIGLNTILQCLVSAVRTGDLPKLPRSWLNDIDNVYGTSFSFDEELSYYDYEEYKKGGIANE